MSNQEDALLSGDEVHKAVRNTGDEVHGVVRNTGDEVHGVVRNTGDEVHRVVRNTGDEVQGVVRNTGDEVQGVVRNTGDEVHGVARNTTSDQHSSGDEVHGVVDDSQSPLSEINVHELENHTIDADSLVVAINAAHATITALRAHPLDANHEKSLHMLEVLLQSPYISPEGKAKVANEINDANVGPNALSNVVSVEDYYRSNILSFMASKAASEYSPYPTSATATPDGINQLHSEGFESNRRSGNFAWQLGKRDCFRDCFLHQLSETLIKRALEKRDGEALVKKLTGVEDLGNEVLWATDGAHIVPFHTAGFKEENIANQQIGWTCFYDLFPELRSIISTTNINDLSNGLTLTKDMHDRFGSFQFGLKHRRDEIYEIVWFAPRGAGFLKLFDKDFDMKPIVSFRYAPDTHPDIKVSRELLRVHCAVAELLQARGAAEPIEYEHEDEDDSSRVPSCAPTDLDAQIRWTESLGRRLDAVLRNPFSN